MNINASKMYPDIKPILGKKIYGLDKYRTVLHTDLLDIPIQKLLSVDIIADYVNGYTHNLDIRVQMGLGDFIYDVYRHRELLESTIYRTHRGRLYESRYRVMLPPTSIQGLQVDTLQMHPREELNNRDLFEFSLQGVSLAAEPLKLCTIEGGSSDADRDTYLESLLFGISRNFRVQGEHLLQKVNVSPANNKEPLSSFIIASGTPLLQLPHILQTSGGGVYHSGLGSYVQYYRKSHQWFVYPLYDTSRLDTQDVRVTMIMLDKRFLTEIENTYLEDNDHITILTQVSDDNPEYTRPRPGTRPVHVEFTDAHQVLDGTTVTTPDSISGVEDTPYQSIGLRDRADGLNTIYRPSNPITDNFYQTASELVFNEGYNIDGVWSQSNNGLLKPGLIVTLLREVKGQVVTDQAVVLYHHTVHRLLGQGSGNDEFSSTTYFSLFIQGARL